MGAGGGGLLRLLPMVFRLFGVKGGILALLGIGAFMYLGGDLSSLLGTPSGAARAPAAQQRTASPREQQQVAFVKVVLADTEDTWHKLLGQIGRRYEEPKLVFYRDAVRSACGLGQAAMGPFYCPGDRSVYLDLGFFDELAQRHGAPGDFAQAYVIAHEIGHHVQNLLGIADKVAAARRRLPRAKANALSVRMELQADCFAGIWGHDNRNLLDAGDIDEALNAAAAIGDDRLQRRAQGYVVPESFTHGTSAQRVRWFKRGFESGDLRACDTFGADRL
jgi:predicted metalloprotease